MQRFGQVTNERRSGACCASCETVAQRRKRIRPGYDVAIFAWGSPEESHERALADGAASGLPLDESGPCGCERK